MANSGPPNPDYTPAIHGGFPDPVAEAPYEEGFPLPEAPPDSHLVPGLGRDAIPHYLSFSQITNWANRTYRWGHDEALRMSRTNALAIRRDPVIMDALRTRQIPLVQLPHHVECQNSQDQRQAEGAAFIQGVIDSIPRFQQLKMHLAEALWYGRYGVQLEYEWDWKDGKRYLRVRGHKPINGDKIIFKFSGQAGVLVHATFPGTWQTTEMGRAHFFTPREREQVILHRHEPEDADFFEPELAGSLQGVGIRGRIYWLWYLRSQVTAFLMDYLERVGAGGLTLYYYEAGNVQSLTEVKTAAETQWRNNALLFPRYRDGTAGGPGVEQIQSTTAGAELLRALITEYYDDTIRRYILGQSQASEASGAGLGSGISDYLEGNLGRNIKYDAVNLQEALTTDLVHVLQKYSPYADLPPFTFKFDVDKPNAAEIIGAAQTFYEMGGAIDEDSLREIVGLEKPQEGHSILSKMGNLSPQAVGMAPEGVPMAGTPGPAPQGTPEEMSQPGANGTPQGPIQQRKSGSRLRFSRESFLQAIKSYFPGIVSGNDFAVKHGDSDLGQRGLVNDYVVEYPSHLVYLNYQPDKNSVNLDFQHKQTPPGVKNEWSGRPQLAKGSVDFAHNLKRFLPVMARHGLRLSYAGADKAHDRAYHRLLTHMGWQEASSLGGMIGKQRLRVWNPPNKARLTLQKLGRKIRLALSGKNSRRAKMSRQNRTPTHEELLKLRPLLAKAAQEEYDEWQPDPEEGDPECGFGGICDRIADRLSDVINEHFPDVDVIEGGQPGDDHAYNIYRIGGEHFGVDIHPNVYETGGGYNWKKIPDVQFQPEDVDVWEHEPIEEDEDY